MSVCLCFLLAAESVFDNVDNALIIECQLYKREKKKEAKNVQRYDAIERASMPR